MASILDPLFGAPFTEHRPRGGWRQRIAAYAARSRSPSGRTTKSQASLRQLKLWASGVASAPQVWYQIDGLVSDGFRNPSIDRIHRCASSATDQNCHSRLLHIFSVECGFQDIITHIDGGSVSEVLRPSSLLRLLQTSTSFKQMFGADETRLLEFWSSLLGSEHGRKYHALHPHLRGRSINSLRKTIPITLHEDAGPFSKTKSVNVVSWSPLLGSGAELEQKYLHHAEVKYKGASCCDAAWDDLFADLAALAQSFPGVDWEIVLLFGKGDCEILVRWGMPSYGAAQVICGYCDCDRRRKLWTDLRSSRVFVFRPCLFLPVHVFARCWSPGPGPMFCSL